MAKKTIDIPQYDLPEDILSILLKDRTTGKNIIWATDDYSYRGEGFTFNDEITIDCITGFNRNLVIPRVEKTIEEQRGRSKDKAEVFTPTWVCNAQNNLIDEKWFDRPNVFNKEIIDNLGHSWQPTDIINEFPTGKTWKKYIRDQRLEMTCGEAPYLCSRYDAATGDYISDLKMRIGILDRKMRLIKENAEEHPSDPPAQWRNWTSIAFKSIYGFDYQGDSLLIARKNLLFTYIDYYIDRWGSKPNHNMLKLFAEIISWNLWQMDGFSFGIPGQAPDENSEIPEQKFCKIMEWDMNYRRNGGKEIMFKTLIK